MFFTASPHESHKPPLEGQLSSLEETNAQEENGEAGWVAEDTAEFIIGTGGGGGGGAAGAEADIGDLDFLFNPPQKKPGRRAHHSSAKNGAKGVVRGKAEETATNKPGGDGGGAVGDTGGISKKTPSAKITSKERVQQLHDTYRQTQASILARIS